MKKKLPPTPVTTEVPSPAHGYVLLPDGTPARRLKPLTIGNQVYYQLVHTDGESRRVRKDKLPGLLPGA